MVRTENLTTELRRVANARLWLKPVPQLLDRAAGAIECLQHAIECLQHELDRRVGELERLQRADAELRSELREANDARHEACERADELERENRRLRESASCPGILCPRRRMDLGVASPPPEYTPTPAPWPQSREPRIIFRPRNTAERAKDLRELVERANREAIELREGSGVVVRFGPGGDDGVTVDISL